MDKYIIYPIYENAYDRFVSLNSLDNGMKLNAHFYDYDRYIADNTNLLGYNKGDEIHHKSSFFVVNGLKTEVQLTWAKNT